MINRSRFLNNKPPQQGPVLYWMDRDQRLNDNLALLEASALSIARDQPLVVAYVLSQKTMSPRQYVFMLQGLKELEARFQANKISFVVLKGDPIARLEEYIKVHEIGSVVTDFTPIRRSREWRQGLAARLDIEVREVDAHNIVPTWLVSDKKEYAASTFRPKIQKMLPQYLTEFPQMRPHPVKSTLASLNDWDVLAQFVGVTMTDPVLRPSGEQAAMAVLEEFIMNRLEAYPTDQHIATRHGQSELSPYLHFGQISAQRVVRAVTEASVDPAVKEVFLEQLIVRRELADNFCYYEPRYDSVEAFPRWASKAFQDHILDPRPHLTTREEFEQGKTHDALWNACQTELVKQGRMPGYLRMYWAKKILEWTHDPEEALATAIELNDRYALDGNDPNGYCGIAWSIGGVHDRPWIDRPIFGQVRYMNLSGCKKKFNVDAYIHKANKV